MLWLLLLIAGCALSSLIPPVQSPDEHSHLMRAYMISRGHWLLETPPGASTGGMVDQGLLQFSDAYLSTIATRADARLTPAQKAQAESLRWGQEERFFPVPGTGYYLPVVYAPHAAALFAGRALDLTVANSYRLARLFTWGLCLGLLAAAFRILAPPVLAVALLLLPMTAFQLLSPTLDGLTTCLAVLALSLFLRGLRNEGGGAALSWALSLCVLVLATSRIQLMPLVALPFFLAWRRSSARDAWLGAAVLALSLGWIGYALLNTVDLRVTRTHGTGELLRYYAMRPGSFVQVIENSLADPALSRFYADSFIGILGWLDTRLPAFAYPLLWAGLAVCAAATLAAASPREQLAARLLVLAAAAASAMMVFLALLVTWTVHPAVTVAGVQGRYFVVPAIMAAYALGAPDAQRARFLRLPVLGLFSAPALYALVATVWARYH